LSGGVTVGENSFIGAGATIIQNTNIIGNTLIGAGAVVIKDITRSGVYVGNPAKLVEKS
jgi:acetyltransferase-like isoleucine patch superfamily enzyme